jgi:hypothetical protein
MIYGVCLLSIVPMRLEAKDTSELVSQIIYGETFKVLEKRSKWSLVKLSFDNYKGWIDNKQYEEISKKQYEFLINEKDIYSLDLIEFIQNKNNELITIPFGSRVSGINIFNHTFEGNKVDKKLSKENIVKTSLLLLNSPYLWGGRTPFGIDCSGFTQQVYRLAGYQLLRDANQQAEQGKEIKLKNSKPGDLAFFGEKKVTHVGILINKNKIIHAFGSVRIDYINEKGIINSDSNILTHHLKKIVTY